MSPRIITVWRLGLILRILAIVLVLLVGSALLDRLIAGAIIAAAVLALGAVFAMTWPGARYRSWSFAVGDADVIIRRGVWWRVTSIIPHARIQHVDTTHGPLERKLGLSSVVIFTAGTIGASVSIPGLPTNEAEQLRDTLAMLARIGEAV